MDTKSYTGEVAAFLWVDIFLYNNYRKSISRG
jgi:hypothetical protein